MCPQTLILNGIFFFERSWFFLNKKFTKSLILAPFDLTKLGRFEKKNVGYQCHMGHLILYILKWYFTIEVMLVYILMSVRTLNVSWVKILRKVKTLWNRDFSDSLLELQLNDVLMIIEIEANLTWLYVFNFFDMYVGMQKIALYNEVSSIHHNPDLRNLKIIFS